MKKKIIIAIVVFLVLALGVGSYFLFFNKDEDDKKSSQKEEKITITFDADGGTKVEDLKVKKESSFSLPQTTKEGYVFLGWYNGSKLYTDDDTSSIKKNIVLTAKWEEVTSKDVVLTVTFDSKGGSKVKDMTFKCSDGAATLKNLPKSKKDAYNFMSWEDKHGKSILDGASIVCEDKDSTLKLYAVWEYDGPVANPEQDPKDSVGYKCETGDLSGDKCVITKDAVLGCDIQHEKEINGKCYSVRDYKPTVCRVQVGMTGSGSSLRPILEEGSLYKEGSTFVCYKEKVSACDTDHKIMGICYKYVERKSSSFNPCADAGSQYVYIIGNQLYGTVEKGTGASTGCYIPKDKHYVCEAGYTLKDSKCTKTIAATKLQ